MFGPPSSSSTPLYSVKNFATWGVIPKILFVLLEKIGQSSSSNSPSSPSGSSPSTITSTSLTLNCFQIYNESIFDLLNDSSRKNSLNIREEKKEIFIAGLSEYKILSMEDALYVRFPFLLNLIVLIFFYFRFSNMQSLAARKEKQRET